MGDVHRQSHICEVEAVAEADERQADNVVAHELLEVLARLLHAQHEDNGLLGPVGGLEQVVELEDGLVCLVREVGVHAGSVEIPDGGAAHDIHAPRAGEGEVDGGVHLFHEASLLAPVLDAPVASQGPQELLHDELAGEGQDDGVEGDKGEIPGPLAIVRDGVRVGVGRNGQLVAEEDEVVDGVGLGGIDGVKAEEDGDKHGGQDAGVLDGIVGRPLRQATCLASLGLAFRGAADAVSRVGFLCSGGGRVSELRSILFPGGPSGAVVLAESCSGGACLP